MDVVCSDMAGLDHQKKGFHTFLMTGDAIIRTNFNPFKPSRQLSLDSQPEPSKQPPKAERSFSNQETSTSDNNNASVAGAEESITSPNYQTDAQNKEFIPGFMRVDEQANFKVQHNADDSGIDVRLSGELEEPKASQEDGGGDKELVVDEASAKRLATRLYQLDGFKLTDVCHYLSKSDEFTQKAVMEFMSFFDFESHPLVGSLRTFLGQVSFQDSSIPEKESLLMHFTKRYLECNHGNELATTFRSNDACHTLVCALMLLNSDLHETAVQKVTPELFIESIAGCNEGKDFSRELLTSMFIDIYNQRLLTAPREEDVRRRFSDSLTYGVEPLEPETSLQDGYKRWPHTGGEGSTGTSLSSIKSPYPKYLLGDSKMKKGYLLKKHCKGPNGVKTPSGRRGWKRHFAVLKDLRLVLLKTEKRSQVHKADKFIDIDNAFASEAAYYTKRKNGFAVTTSDGSEFLLIAGDRESMNDWINSINLSAASNSRFEGKPERIGEDSQPGSFGHMTAQLEYYKQQIQDTGNHLLHSQGDLPPQGATREEMKKITERKLLQQRNLQKYTSYVTALTVHLDRLKAHPVEASAKPRTVESPYLAGCRMSYRLAVYGDSDY